MASQQTYLGAILPSPFTSMICHDSWHAWFSPVYSKTRQLFLKIDTFKSSIYKFIASHLILYRCCLMETSTAARFRRRRVVVPGASERSVQRTPVEAVEASKGGLMHFLMFKPQQFSVWLRLNFEHSNASELCEKWCVSATGVIIPADGRMFFKGCLNQQSYERFWLLSAPVIQLGECLISKAGEETIKD